MAVRGAIYLWLCVAPDRSLSSWKLKLTLHRIFHDSLHSTQSIEGSSGTDTVPADGVSMTLETSAEVDSGPLASYFLD